MPIFIAILFAVSIILVEILGWRLSMAIWVLLFMGTGVIKLISMAI